jgi:hypothetical protein
MTWQVITYDTGGISWASTIALAPLGAPLSPVVIPELGAMANAMVCVYSALCWRETATAAAWLYELIQRDNDRVGPRLMRPCQWNRIDPSVRASMSAEWSRRVRDGVKAIVTGPLVYCQSEEE